MECPSCHSPVSATVRFCPECGASMAELEATLPAGPPPDATVPSGPGGMTSSGVSRPGTSAADEDFAPGSLVADRYRIVGQLGRGGMGEVYRADDLTLGQSVALKFLPREFATQESRRTRFFHEVRIAREVAHPNVCRVYDIGELDGQLFLSMEYVDGEDLQSLLRRIGRLPQEKAVDLARQLCAGLTALHDKGVLHRDLKPANVMLDGRGQVRITDFGLAGVAAEIEGAEIRSGTPAYMAPEQLAGREVTERSDLYSLGLILYELFTGKPAFQADSVAELSRLQSESAPSSLTTHVSDVDPAVDRVIARCLEKDPARRPPSAIALAAALPGGDPLAAALAAGETPSPELVAASGGEGGVHPGLAFGLFGVLVVGVLLFAGIGSKEKLHRWIRLDSTADELRVRARDLCASVGFTDQPFDEVHGFGSQNSWLQYLARNDSTGSRWDRVDEGPSGVVYWYRQSPDRLTPEGLGQQAGYGDPPHDVARMVRLLLRPDGRLMQFAAVPPESAAEVDSTVAWDWDVFFAASGFERSRFTEVPSEWIPDTFATERRAWEGAFPDQADLAVRIEAGAVGPVPVHWRVTGEWTGDTRTAVGESRSLWTNPETWGTALFLGALFGSFLLAWRNVRQGRGDIQGAFHLAVFITILMTIDWLLRATFPDRPGQVPNFIFFAMGFNAFVGSLVFALYLALEPLVRRRWPGSLIAWTRLVHGEVRDPLVGRAILLGAAAYLMVMGLELGRFLVADGLGLPPARPDNINWNSVLGVSSWVRYTANGLVNGMLQPMLLLVLLVLLRYPLRYEKLTTVVFLLLISTMGLGEGYVWWLDLATSVLRGVVLLFVLTRWGLLSATFASFADRMLSTFPVSLDPSPACRDASTFALVVVLGIGALAVWTALAGRSIWHSPLED